MVKSSLKAFESRYQGLLRKVAFLTLFPLGATVVIGVFYGLYEHLPPYLSLVWRGTLGASFAIAALALTAAWLLLLTFDVLLTKN